MTQASNTDGMHLFAAGIGVAIILVCAALSDRPDLTDSGLYWSIGLPLAYVMTGVCGYLAPERPWHWVGWLFGGKIAAVLVIGLFTGGLSLWPLTIVFFAVIALPGLATAYLGAWFSRGRNSSPPRAGKKWA